MSRKKCITLIWVAWGILNILMAYQLRFWVNSDTIGSLDSARYLQYFDLKSAINAYWGLGFAAFLSIVPLSNPQSWFGIHLITVLLLLFSQLFIYNALKKLNISPYLAAFISLIWMTSCYATGSAVFVTADVALVFFASLYLFLTLSIPWDSITWPRKRAFFLGATHGLAAITKFIAFPTLLIFPVGISLITFFRLFQAKRPTSRVIGNLSCFLTLYFIPLIFCMAVWGFLCKSKYGHFTLGTTAPYVQARFVKKLDAALAAESEMRKQIPKIGTYWWSDVGISLKTSFDSIKFDPLFQLKQCTNNLLRLTKKEPRHLRDGCVLLAISLVTLTTFFYRKSGSVMIADHYWVLLALCFGTLALYLNSLFLSRYFPFAVLFALPIFAILSSHWLNAPQRFPKIFTIFFLSGSLFHGLVAMASVAHLAPGNQHFEVAQFIRGQSIGPIGVFQEPTISFAHYGTIAFVANRQAAEMIPIDPNDEARYEATFRPGSVLIVTKKDEQIPHSLWVKNRKFLLRNSWTYTKGKTKREFHVFLPLDEGQ